MSKLLLYCTKNKWRLFFDEVKQVFTLGKVKSNNDLNGKIIAECDFEVEKIRYVEYADEWGYETNTLNEDDLIDKSCLSGLQLNNYLRHCKNGAYAIHIKNLHIFDEPRDLRDYSKNENPYNYIENAPQNMMYAYDVKSFNNFEKKVLISIQPQWMCLLLNRIKDVEVRKVVLKEMIK